ncbi:MAG: Phosphoribosyl-AMP cyclohydrolase [Catillopecten margaritatus gill symbiont]|uniref:Phosphoribosyl-AMP cyclohydrolase n=1 Tax=Catillopecten margaritatus gill symbiont TaxID=3083288 RepID=A0AAU6PF05_9GAMM
MAKANSPSAVVVRVGARFAFSIFGLGILGKINHFIRFLLTVCALEKIRFDSNGLIPAIAQDFATGEILMFAWMNAESLALTIEKQQAVYYSRSRKKLWFKGEESGHTQLIKEIRTDCDNDVILLKVEQVGGIACHTGRKSCFFQKLENTDWNSVEKVLKDPKDIYG